MTPRALAPWPKNCANSSPTLLPYSPNDYASARNVYYLTLGRFALANGDTATAKSNLLDAGHVEGSPWLASFELDMSLAAEPSEAGESKVVLVYFRLCEAFWEPAEDHLPEWRAAIASG